MISKNHLSIKAIIFDFGGVILDLTKRHILSIPQALSVLFEIPIEKSITLWRESRSEVLIGKASPHEFLDKINQQLKTDKSINQLLRAWEIMNTKSNQLIDWDVMAFIEQLKQQYKIYVLSDAISLGQDDKFSQELESKFDGVFLSYREGYRKPSQEAFLNVLNKTKFRPNECIFIDDSEENVKSAELLGIKSVKFINLEKLKAELASLGIS